MDTVTYRSMGAIIAIDDRQTLLFVTFKIRAGTLKKKKNPTRNTASDNPQEVLSNYITLVQRTEAELMLRDVTGVLALRYVGGLPLFAAACSACKIL